MDMSNSVCLHQCSREWSTYGAGAPISQWRGRLIDNAPSCDTLKQQVTDVHLCPSSIPSIHSLFDATTTVPASNGLIYMLNHPCSTRSDYSAVVWRRACTPNGNINDQHQEACLLVVNDGLVHCIPPANAEFVLVIDPGC
ncbi:hypothetical protein PTSG_02862 [Salpingoeca rosetta]|uniref:Uncharacterized protein n=1 Tax=Salpingoeca rosetta (strain ATCC 50818 / BSB-021) TaxID=946362 RepID=F2U3J6_SALR5|nr:uncharacterized protein PTSG_02862 [Salpingoeca rosetta]EGD82190.1 hypothetical protein PTSG_02862 [Salpingoeca rosetta]|eukprot:XP_004996373.1 hypothetical protein PTSG_02862 [Salpingoeca rosetta]